LEHDGVPLPSALLWGKGVDMVARYGQQGHPADLHGEYLWQASEWLALSACLPTLSNLHGLLSALQDIFNADMG